MASIRLRANNHAPNGVGLWRETGLKAYNSETIYIYIHTYNIFA